MIPTAALHYAGPGPLPEDLFAPRTRNVLTRLGDAWPEPGRIGLPVGGQDQHNALAAGARREPDGRLSALRKAAVSDPLQPYVPLIARREFQPLRVETAPASSPGSSLARLLDAETWRRFEHEAFETAGRVCELCGSGFGAPECHEIWTFHPPAHGYEPGVQRLEGLLCLCSPCHEIFHPGAAVARGHRNEIIRRLCVLNGWSEAEHRRYAEWGNALAKSRAAVEWELDLTPFARLGPFAIGPSWRLELRDNSLVPLHGDGRPRRVRIVGVPWRIGDYLGNAIRSPLPPLPDALTDP